MKLIIEIDENVIIAISRMGLLRIPDEMQKKVDKAIQRGTPLPKGHGDLVDRDTYYSALEEKIKDWDVTSTEIHDKIHGISIARNICNRLIPIIESDKDGKDASID